MFLSLRLGDILTNDTRTSPIADNTTCGNIALLIDKSFKMYTMEDEW
jgi:hypothetical protein